MWKRKYTFEEAMEFVRSKRGFIDPNLGFVGQLMELSKKFLANRGITPISVNCSNRDSIKKRP